MQLRSLLEFSEYCYSGMVVGRHALRSSRPQTEPEVLEFEKVHFKVQNMPQDKFDHDKGQKSAISGRRLHWRLSTGFFVFSPVFMCNLVRRAPQNLEKVAKNPVEKIASNPVTSVAVMVFSALNAILPPLPPRKWSPKVN